jgi:hypothetical protein
MKGWNVGLHGQLRRPEYLQPKEGVKHGAHEPSAWLCSHSMQRFVILHPKSVATRDGPMNDIYRAGSLVVMILAVLVAGVADSRAASLDQLNDLTGKANAIVTLMSRDNFSSEYRYHVTVRNNSADAFVADSLVVVLDRITNIAGEDREALKNESLLSRMEIVGQDGETEDGKPYFRIPPGGRPDLTPYSESPPATVRIRNRDYVAVFTPSFRVLGLKRESPKPKTGESAATTSQPKGAASTEKLIQLLQKKGLITEEEARTLRQP